MQKRERPAVKNSAVITDLSNAFGYLNYEKRPAAIGALFDEMFGDDYFVDVY